MSEAKHTPGPWGLIERKGPRAVTLKRTHWSVGGGPEARGVAIAFGDTDANARLIAAAPDLLAALKDARLYVNGSSSSCKELRASIEAVIAKAEGATK